MSRIVLLVMFASLLLTGCALSERIRQSALLKVCGPYKPDDKTYMDCAQKLQDQLDAADAGDMAAATALYTK